jgi:hypothetical protein
MTHHKLEIHKLLLYITAIAFLTSLAQARPAMLVNSYSVASFDDSTGDPLDPGILGESMSMPLPIEMIHAAINAGIAKDSKALYAYDDGLGGYAISNNKDSAYKDSITAPVPTSDAMDPPRQSVQNANVTGPWSFYLKDRFQRHLDLALVQNKEAILGHGIIEGPNGTQRVTASGSHIGERLDLTLMLVDSLDLYRLNLSFDSNTTGTYTAYSASGDTWSGYISGSSPSGISNPAPQVSENKPEPVKKADRQNLANLGQKSSSSTSTSIGVSSAGGTNSMESYSSTSESAAS